VVYIDTKLFVLRKQKEHQHSTTTYFQSFFFVTVLTSTILELINWQIQAVTSLHIRVDLNFQRRSIQVNINFCFKSSLLDEAVVNHLPGQLVVGVFERFRNFPVDKKLFVPI